MDATEWILHTTKSGKILYYINPVTGECKWKHQLNKEDSQNVDTDFHSRKLDQPSQASRLQPSCEKDVQGALSSGSHTNAHVPHPSQTQLSSTSSCVITNGIKEEREHYSHCEKQSNDDVELFNHQEREVTVDILAECKTARIHCVESGAVSIPQPADCHLDNVQMSNNVSKGDVDQQQILKCPQCNEQFFCPNKFASHLRSHPEIDPLKCPICSKEYSSSTSLTTHLRTHTGEKPFECSYCQKCFSQSSHLTTHMRVHTGEKPYHCPKCPKTFGQSSHLTLHLRIHNGEKPFQCRFCTKVFSHSSALSTHMRTHTGEKPFQCPHCPKKFGQSSHLKIHVRTHTGERPFQCPHCLKCFRQSCYLTKHVRGHSSTKSTDIP
ncbi:uncharacterized protein LOC144632701 [Oculina patagonica]